MAAPTKELSAPATTLRVLAQLEELDWTTARIGDVGAGRGHFSHVLSERLTARGLDPAEHVFPCDLLPESFRAPGLECRATGADGRLPFADGELDAAVSIEVIEHVEDQFAFLRELGRVTRPGGLVVVTTPNVNNLNSRLRSLFSGFPLLFDPLPLADQDIRFTSGHIHPVAPYYLAYAALRAGLVEPHLLGDRTKRSATVLACLLFPGLLAGRWLARRRLRRKRPAAWEQNRPLLAEVGGWELLTSRTTILVARKPCARAQHDVGELELVPARRASGSIEAPAGAFAVDGARRLD